MKSGQLVQGMQRRTPSADEVRAVSGPAFRALRAVLKHKDVSGDYGGLSRVVDRSTGSVMWVCEQHRTQDRFGTSGEAPRSEEPTRAAGAGAGAGSGVGAGAGSMT